MVKRVLGFRPSLAAEMGQAAQSIESTSGYRDNLHDGASYAVQAAEVSFAGKVRSTRCLYCLLRGLGLAGRGIRNIGVSRFSLVIYGSLKVL